MEKGQKGLGAVEGLLILVIVGIVGFTGWYAWHSKNVTNSTFNSASSVAANTKASAGKPANSTTQPSSSPSNYIDIKEWGVRLSFYDANKVTYRISSDGNAAFLYLTTQYSSIDSCRNLGVGFTRSTTASGGDNNIKIGSYYYQLGGAPGYCSDDPGGTNGSINQLRSKIDSQELGSGKYSLTATD